MYNTSITPITCLSQKKKFSFYQGCCLNMFFFFSLNWMSESRGVNNGSDSLSNSARTLQPSSLPSPPSCAVTPLHPPPPSLPPSLCCPPALSLQVYRQFLLLLLLLLSFSFSPSPSLPSAPAPPLIAFREKLPLTNSRAPPPPLTLCLWSLCTVTLAPRTYYVNLDLSRLLALQSLRVLLIERCGPPTNFTKHSVLHYTLHHIISTCIAISMSSRVLGYNTWLLFPFVLATSNKHVGSELQRMCLPSSLRNYRTMEGEVG